MAERVKRFNGLPAEVVEPNPSRIIRTITIEVIAHDEDIPVKGNAMASGDDRVDREQERWIQHQLDNGNRWAWCAVEVRATLGDATGAAHLGACSYLSGADFARPDGYFPDMVREAVEGCLQQWAEQEKEAAAAE